jgi:hypothetical protein
VIFFTESAKGFFGFKDAFSINEQMKKNNSALIIPLALSNFSLSHSPLHLIQKHEQPFDNKTFEKI